MVEQTIPPVTASMLYDLVQCPKRVELDLFGDQSRRDDISPFVRLLWERGALHERQAVEGLDVSFDDFSEGDLASRQQRTLEAMQSGRDLIYGGVIAADNLLGIPDLLRREGTRYVPIDIKSGRGKEGEGDDGDGKPKLHYAVQLALYVDILERLGFSSGRHGVIWDVRGDEVVYRLSEPRGVRTPGTLWDEYVECRAAGQAIVERQTAPRGALTSICKLCVWRASCSSELTAAGDLTLIPYVGRSARDAMCDDLPDLVTLATSDPESFIAGGKTPFRRVGPESLRAFHARAQLLTERNSKPYLTAPVRLPATEVDLFFDIEVDPLRDLTYLHGVIERRKGDNTTERFHAFFAEDESPAAEEDAFARTFAHLTQTPNATVWYYSKYERTIYRKLQGRYPGVCSADAIEELFDPKRAVDLYFDVVRKATEWPTNDHSIKTLAKSLGFTWRDTDPSGAASIEWFDRWVTTRDPAVKSRILDYNEDDCRATRVLLDGIRCLASA
jgi:predicted RecB family nuclease